MMRRCQPLSAFLLLGAVFIASEATATIITIPGPPDFVQQVTLEDTFGDQMVGMKVTALFTDSLEEEKTWVAGGARAGGVSGSGWSLSVSPGTSGLPFDNGSTFFDLWSFENTGGRALERLILDGTNGLTVFDRCWPLDFMYQHPDDQPIAIPGVCGVHPQTPPRNAIGDEGTLQSEEGLDFEIVPMASFDFEATYSRPVALEGQAAVEDIWHRLTIDFGLGGLTGNWEFQQDTDNVVPLTTHQMPEPATTMLFVFGLGALAAVRRGGSANRS